VKICACCGFKSANSESGFSDAACVSCGACSVGEALPRPENELPAYGRSLLLAVTGAFSVIVLLSQTIIALVQDSSRTVASPLALSSMVPLDFWSWVGAAETAAWRLKWVAIPLAILVVFGSRRIYRSIQQSPAKFCGHRYARNGYIAAATVPVLILILIGITVPARLRHRQWGIEAGVNANIYRIDRALEEYRANFGGLPSDLKELLPADQNDPKRVSDADGSLAEALKSLDTSGYRPSANLAAVPNKKLQQLRGSVIRNASFNTADDIPGERLSFTNYELPLPGPDKVMGNEDDLVVRDGIIIKAAELPHSGVNPASATQTRKR
jgi:hypothetical protein